MHAIVLAAGEGKRLRPLTEDRPKPMIPINGRPLLEYVLDELPDAVKDIIIVTGYHGEKIREHFGKAYKGRPIIYVEQKDRLGTAHAVHMARPYIRGKFILLNGDDIGDKGSFTEGLEHDYCVFVSEHEDPSRFGVVELYDDHSMKGFEEKPAKPKTNLVSTGTMILSPKIFEIPLIQHPNGEHYIVDAVAKILEEHPVHVIPQKSWITVTFPEDIAKAETLLKERGK
jgi:bifunctional UDP-N-acetylglucosamine pyrophosphorylase/glucosamine-1-phosphate N-acetyltransferase